jgi:hypothetical protein
LFHLLIMLSKHLLVLLDLLIQLLDLQLLLVQSLLLLPDLLFLLLGALFLVTHLLFLHLQLPLGLLQQLALRCQDVALALTGALEGLEGVDEILLLFALVLLQGLEPLCKLLQQRR